MERLLIQSLKEKTPIEMIYKNETGTLTQRVIMLLDVTDMHIRAYCQTRKGIRTFKRQNILSAMPYYNDPKRYKVMNKVI